MKYDKKCYSCDGYDYQCGTYVHLCEEATCVWYRVVQSDLEKLLAGKEDTTFPIKEWIEGNKK